MVDDDEAMRRLLATVLELDGVAVVEAASAAEALDVVRSRPLGLVLSDYRMPGATGLDLLAAVRTERPALPFVLVSGEFPRGVEDRARSAGARLVLSKARLVRDVGGAVALASSS